MKLYVAGPMTGIKDLNFPEFYRVASELRHKGHEVVNPAELNAGNDGDWLACMRNDIAHLAKCDGVAFLGGWMTSRGAKIEVKLAVDLGLPAKMWAEWLHVKP